MYAQPRVEKRIRGTGKEREGEGRIAAITLCSLGYANDLIRNNNKKYGVTNLVVAFSSARGVQAHIHTYIRVYFRQPTKRGEKAAASGGGTARVEPTAQGEGPEEEVNRASGQGEPGALIHRYRPRLEDLLFLFFFSRLTLFFSLLLILSVLSVSHVTVTYGFWGGSLAAEFTDIQT